MKYVVLFHFTADLQRAGDMCRPHGWQVVSMASEVTLGHVVFLMIF